VPLKSLEIEQKLHIIYTGNYSSGIPKLDTPVRFWSPALIFSPKTTIFQVYSTPLFSQRQSSVRDIPLSSLLPAGCESIARAD